MTKRIPYRDLGGPHGVPEDERILQIGNQVMLGKVVGVFVDAEPAKVERYIAKVIAKFPGVECVHRGALSAHGDGAFVVLLKFARKAS